MHAFEDPRQIDEKPFQNPMELIALVSRTQLIFEDGQKSIVKPFIFNRSLYADSVARLRLSQWPSFQGATEGFEKVSSLST